jgi:hypothetical protein
MEQTIIWTAIPNGIDTATNRLKLSVKVSPRLIGDSAETLLGNFGDFAHWAAKSLPLKISVGYGVPLVAALPDPDERDPALWDTLFAGAIVKNHTGDEYRDHRIRSFPAVHIHNYLKGIYSEVGLSFPERHPDKSWLIGSRNVETFLPGKFYGLAMLGLNLGGTRGRIEKVLNSYSVVPPGPPDPQSDFYQAMRFHSFMGGDYALKPPRPRFDFHELISLVEEYPYILRRLGLVINISCPIPQGMDTLTASQRKVRVIPQWTAALSPGHISPCTAYRFNQAARRFEAAPASGSELAGGLLDLSGEGYETVQVDLDGAALKLVDYAGNLYRLLSGSEAKGTPQNAGLPALRTAGIAVISTGRAGKFRQRLDKGGTLNDQLKAAVTATSPTNGENILLHADDLVRGLRIDVKVAKAGPDDPRSGPWRSLCQRVEIFKLRKSAQSEKPYATVPGEGVVTAAATSPINGEKELRLHEALFHWDGWSLAVRRPGKKNTGSG